MHLPWYKTTISGCAKIVDKFNGTAGEGSSPMQQHWDSAIQL